MTLRKLQDGHVFFFLDSANSTKTPIYMKIGRVMVELPENKNMVTVTGNEKHAVLLTSQLLELQVIDVSLMIIHLIITACESAA